MDQQKGLLTTATGTSQPKRTKRNELGTQEHWNTWNMGTDASARRDHRKGQVSSIWSPGEAAGAPRVVSLLFSHNKENKSWTFRGVTNCTKPHSFTHLQHGFVSEIGCSTIYTGSKLTAPQPVKVLRAPSFRTDLLRTSTTACTRTRSDKGRDQSRSEALRTPAAPWHCATLHHVFWIQSQQNRRRP